jgi:hypothetical protein
LAAPVLLVAASLAAAQTMTPVSAPAKSTVAADTLISPQAAIADTASADSVAAKPVSRADTAKVVKHHFNHRQQIITGGAVMASLAAIMTVMNNYNPQ